MNHSFNDIEDILFHGTKEEMEQLTCPICNGALFYDSNELKSFRIQCTKCSSRVKMSKLSRRPNCFDIYGSSHIF